jgi:putative Mg2+ transporter-C (MgtC) family protein
MRRMIADHGFTIANLSYRLDRVDDFFEYRMVICTDRKDNARRLSETLSALDAVKEFRLSSTVD